MPLIALLVGPPGAGKTTLACSLKGSGVVIDVDYKAAEMSNLRPRVESKELTIWPVTSPFVDETFTQRTLRMMKDKSPPASEPQGFIEMGRLCDKLVTDPVALAADTWIIDSFTRAGEHLKRLISYYNKRATMAPKDYGVFLTRLEEVIDVLKKRAQKHGKNLICTVHVRYVEVPQEDVEIVRTGGEKASEERTGTFSVRTVAALDGQIAAKLGSYFNEVYWLTATPGGPGGKIKYLARTVPDGQSDARTSRKLEDFIPQDLNYVIER